MRHEELNRYLDGMLEFSRVRDYCPNALLVEGRGEIRRIVAAVTARVDPIQARSPLGLTLSWCTMAVSGKATTPG